MRTVLTISVLAIYVLLFNIYIHEMTIMSHRRCTLLYNYITVSMLIYFLVDLKLGLISFLHEQFNLLCILSVIVNFILIILSHHNFIGNPETLFLTFNGSIFATTIILLVSLKRHGYFNRK